MYLREMWLAVCIASVFCLGLCLWLGLDSMLAFNFGACKRPPVALKVNLGLELGLVGTVGPFVFFTYTRLLAV